MSKNFRRELEYLINRYSKENGSDTPDFILADFLEGCLNLFDLTIKTREKWYGRDIVATVITNNQPTNINKD